MIVRVVLSGCLVCSRTDRTDGGAFLYLFSRFLFPAALDCASVSAGISLGDSLPPSVSLLSGLGKALMSVKSPEKFMSYWRVM